MMTGSDPNSITIHGVFMDVQQCGIFLTGRPGIGKSELALGLVTNGHRLVADDAVQFTRKNDYILGACPPLLQDFLEIRGLGIINMRAMYGDDVITRAIKLDLIINLIHIKQEAMASIDRLHGMHRARDILQMPIPEITIPVAAGRNLAILVEAAVQAYKLKQQGYIAADEFCAKQRAALDNAPQSRQDSTDDIRNP